MHFLPDTGDEDAARERYWPDGFKRVIREEVGQAARVELNGQTFGRVYVNKFSVQYSDLKAFTERIVDLVVIGAENGADLGFEAVYKSFLNEAPLPRANPYATYFFPPIPSQERQEKIRKAIDREYSEDEGFQYAYKAGYARKYENFAEFIREISGLMIVEMVNGADDMLGKIYRSFLAGRDLPVGRRNPRLLKDW